MIKIVQVVNEIEISKRTKNKNSFSKAKRKGKSTKFLAKFVSLPVESMEEVEKWNEDTKKRERC